MTDKVKSIDQFQSTSLRTFSRNISRYDILDIVLNINNRRSEGVQSYFLLLMYLF